MYMAYGWPQVIPLEQGLSPSAQKIVYLKLINRTLLVVSPTHFELWSTSQVRGSVQDVDFTPCVIEFRVKFLSSGEN